MAHLDTSKARLTMDLAVVCPDGRLLKLGRTLSGENARWHKVEWIHKMLDWYYRTQLEFNTKRANEYMAKYTREHQSG